MSLWFLLPLKILGLRFWELVHEVSQVYLDPPELPEE